jgi:hypothetical protein
VDIGSQNSAWCLYGDRRIMCWHTHKLLEVHEPRVRSTSEVLARLDEIYQHVANVLQGRDYFVLIEDQPIAPTDMKKGLVFNRELQHIVHAFFHAKFKEVKFVDPLERYRLLGIVEPTKLSRADRKGKVVQHVEELLKNSTFRATDHDLTEWASGVRKRDDLADALVQALAFFHRNMATLDQDARTENNTAPLVKTPEPPRGPKRARVVTKEDLQGRLEALLSQLQMQHYDLVRAHKDYANKIYSVYSTLKAQSRSDSHLESFLELLHEFNHQGTAVQSPESLRARLE